MQRSDADIRSDVEASLEWDSRVDAANVDVDVLDAVVTLLGTVSTTGARQAAFTDAWVRGVRDVADRLTVQTPTAISVPLDDNIQEQAENVLEWNGEIDSTDVSVDVRDGVVRIEGSVGAYWQKIEAGDLVGNLEGVRDVRNELAVVPTEQYEDIAIADCIVAALERNAMVDASEVNVTVEEGKVTLGGTVPTWAARQAAHDIAGGTRGVCGVDDRLAVVVEATP